MKKSTKRKFPRYLAFDGGNDPSGQFARLASSEKSIQLELYVLVKLDSLPPLAAELVRLKVNVIITGGPTPTPAKEATSP